MVAGQENKNSQVLEGEVQEWGGGWGVGPEKGSGQRPGGFTEVKDTHSVPENLKAFLLRTASSGNERCPQACPSGETAVLLADVLCELQGAGS